MNGSDDDSLPQSADGLTMGEKEHEIGDDALPQGTGTDRGEIVESEPRNRPSRHQKRPSLRATIDAKCKECIYDPHEMGAWRMQVEACTSPDCPLYAVRPLSRRRKANGLAEKAAFSPQNGGTTGNKVETT